MRTVVPWLQGPGPPRRPSARPPSSTPTHRPRRRRSRHGRRSASPARHHRRDPCRPAGLLYRSAGCWLLLLRIEWKATMATGLRPAAPEGGLVFIAGDHKAWSGWKQRRGVIELLCKGCDLYLCAEPEIDQRTGSPRPPCRLFMAAVM